MPKLPQHPMVQEAASVHPVLGGRLDPHAHRILGDLAGLTQFGCHIEELPPGSRSGHRHWHEREDEFIYVLAGEVVLVEDTETVLRPGDAAAWPAGLPVGHCLANRSGAPARYLTVGSRYRQDVVHFPDEGLVLRIDGPARRWFHSDMTPREVADPAADKGV